eukprot:TRINITY_DN8887_c0_g1_i1.p4 TRINITY_DN8887_c0_g1~~TRINITY_DN8887_c0_g1_i1.p4  ORF type:complete len:176 (-),score=8.51 TRINITY_DN8887_c0_g1_i1:68-595(-)
MVPKCHEQTAYPVTAVGMSDGKCRRVEWRHPRWSVEGTCGRRGTAPTAAERGGWRTPTLRADLKNRSTPGSWPSCPAVISPTTRLCLLPHPPPSVGAADLLREALLRLRVPAAAAVRARVDPSLVADPLVSSPLCSSSAAMASPMPVKAGGGRVPQSSTPPMEQVHVVDVDAIPA